jgi:hypothetical protein
MTIRKMCQSEFKPSIPQQHFILRNALPSNEGKAKQALSISGYDIYSAARYLYFQCGIDVRRQINKLRPKEEK